MVLHDFKCPVHGHFEGSHAICPALGCDSEGVKKIFLKPPGVLSAATRFTDTSLKGIAQDYRLSDMRNTDGQAVAQANPGAAQWGTESIPNLPQVLADGNKPYVLKKTINGREREFVADNMGLRAAASATGFDQRVLPPAKTTVLGSDHEDRKKVAR